MKFPSDDQPDRGSQRGQDPGFAGEVGGEHRDRKRGRGKRHSERQEPAAAGEIGPTLRGEAIFGEVGAGLIAGRFHGVNERARVERSCVEHCGALGREIHGSVIDAGDAPQGAR